MPKWIAKVDFVTLVVHDWIVQSYFNTFLCYVCSVTFCGAAVLKIMDQGTLVNCWWSYKGRITVYTAYLRKVVRKNEHTTIPKGDMGYVQYAVPDTVAVKPVLLLLHFFSTCKHTSMSSHAIFFFQFLWRTVNSKPSTGNLIGLPLTLFPATFLKIAVYKHLKSLPDTSLPFTIFDWKRFARHKSISLRK